MALRTGFPTPIASRTSASTGAAIASAFAAPVVADVREAMGVGPVRTPA